MSLGQDIRATLDALDIHVDAVRPGLLGCDHRLTQTGKVSREDGRSKLYGMCVHIPSPSWSQFSDRERGPTASSDSPPILRSSPA